jgi:hypothetical protein
LRRAAQPLDSKNKAVTSRVVIVIVVDFCEYFCYSEALLR